MAPDKPKFRVNELKNLTSSLGPHWELDYREAVRHTRSPAKDASPPGSTSSQLSHSSHRAEPTRPVERQEHTIVADPRPQAAIPRPSIEGGRGSGGVPSGGAATASRPRRPLPGALFHGTKGTPRRSGVFSGVSDQAMSQRSRPRGSNRNSEAGSHGEEHQLWQTCKADLLAIVDEFNQSSKNVDQIRDLDHQLAQAKTTDGKTAVMFNNLDQMMRSGVKINDALGPRIKRLIENLKILRAVQANKEEKEEQLTSRSAAQRAKEQAASSSVYDFDGAGESPVPSPNPAVSRRMGGKGDRDSMPPKADRSTPAAKQGSVEPQGVSTGSIARSKVTFAKGDEVAFKPKLANGEQSDWILGIVQEVRGEGKARRYRVLDADVDEAGNQKDFRTSASSMILIPKEGTVLAPLETGKVVLALYPNTTTFYKAEVMGMDDDGKKVNLKFEGEESSNTMQAVTRRHVVEYRG